MKLITKAMMKLGKVAIERTGWRDRYLSLRHRCWGSDITAVDLDFVEFIPWTKEPVALTEYKNERSRWRPSTPVSASMQALINLANRSRLPFFVVQYSSDFKKYTIWPINEYAKEFETQFFDCVTFRKTIDESEFIEFQYTLRYRERCFLHSDAYEAVLQEFNERKSDLDEKTESRPVQYKK